MFERFFQGVKNRAQVSTIGADGGSVTAVVDGGQPSFSPNGRRILYYSESSIFTLGTDDDTSPDTVLFWPGGGVADPEYSPDGRWIVFAGEPAAGETGPGESGPGIWSVRRDGSHLRRLTSPERNGAIFDQDMGPTFSPDGRHISFVHIEDVGVSGDADINVMRADGSDKHPVPNTKGAGMPAYAPAGDRIALSLASGGEEWCRDIYTISPTGSDRQRVTEDCGVDAFSAPSWQPDPASTFSFGRLKKNKRKGTVKLEVGVLEPGDVELAKNKKVKGKHKSADSEGTVKLPIKPKRKAKEQLNRKGKAKVKAKVTYTPDGGPPNTQSKKVELKKKR